MDLEKIKKEKEQQYNQLLNKLQSLDKQRQMLINEILRLEGELRLLNYLINSSSRKKEGGGVCDNS